MSLAALYVLLLPAIGYLCVHKKNKLQKKLKPISGLELTYYSAAAGVPFLIAAYILAKSFTFCVGLYLTDYGFPFLSHLVSELDPQIGYFLLAGLLSALWSLRLRADSTIWEGDANTGKVWGELLGKETIVVIFLKSGKCYQGLLLEVEVSERVAINERLVTLFVILSGNRNPSGIVDWNTKYGTPLRHHFFMSEITNFSEYSAGATFKIQSKRVAKK